MNKWALCYGFICTFGVYIQCSQNFAIFVFPKDSMSL